MFENLNQEIPYHSIGKTIDKHFAYCLHQRGKQFLIFEGILLKSVERQR